MSNDSRRDGCLLERSLFEKLNGSLSLDQERLKFAEYKIRVLGGPMRQDAVMRRIQIIGEAVRHLSHQVVASIPDFPAKEARAMRNVLVHDYEGLNLERLWDTAIQDIPAIRNAVEKYLRPHTGGNGWEKLKKRIPDAPPIPGDELP